jgi:hypothetical protein
MNANKTVTIERFGYTNARGSRVLDVPTYTVFMRCDTIADAKAYLRSKFDCKTLSGSFRVAKAGRVHGTYHLRLGVARTASHPEGAGFTPGAMTFEHAVR